MRKQKGIQPSIDILYRVVVSPVHWALSLSPIMILMWRLENSDPVDVLGGDQRSPSHLQWERQHPQCRRSRWCLALPTKLLVVLSALAMLWCPQTVLGLPGNITLKHPEKSADDFAHLCPEVVDANFTQLVQSRCLGLVLHLKLVYELHPHHLGNDHHDHDLQD